MKKRALGSVAAATVSLGAIATPGMAQSHTPPDHSRHTQMQPPANHNNPPAGDPCAELVVAGGIVLAGGALALKRSKRATEDQLLRDDKAAREWEHWHGRR